MSLEGFSQKPRGKPRRPEYVNQPPRPAEVRRGPRDRDECPSGWDADVWHLSLFFRQRAQADGIELRAGLPVIYSEIDNLVSRHGIRRQTFRQETDGCLHRTDSSKLAAHCWLHWPPMQPADQSPGPLTWVQVADVIIAEFWSRIWDEHALDHFRQHFAEYGQAAVRHWQNLAILRDARANAKPHVIVRRRNPGATMSVTSKEG